MAGFLVGIDNNNGGFMARTKGKEELGESDWSCKKDNIVRDCKRLF